MNDIVAATHYPGSEHRALYRALQSHDTRFDGRLFVGVRSTGIYCRPVCTVRLPTFTNCAFFAHAAGAEQAGYRPCLVCRPELAPGDANVDAVSKLARLAWRRIEDGALNEGKLEQLAAEFGVCAHHLRRAFVAEFGITPIELAQTQRLLQAKQLLTETQLSVTDVAFAAGFDSIRRFNAVFKQRYRMPPTALRRTLKTPTATALSDAHSVAFRLDYRPPLNWRRLLAFLGERAIPGVEWTHGEAYLRTVRVAQHRGWISVQPVAPTRRKHALNALELTLSASLLPVCVTVISKIKTVFDLRADAAEIDRHLARDSLLAAPVAAHGGMRLPGAFDGFELLLRAILGQQVSVKGATTLAGRMAQTFGEVIETPWPELSRLTPDPARIAQASVAQVAKIGMPGKRAETIRLVARANAEGSLRLAPGADPEAAGEQLIAFPGIGEWTASYVAMRALAWPDALPLGDLGVKKALGMTRARDILERTESWRPWRAYAAIYLWLSLSGG